MSDTQTTVGAQQADVVVIGGGIGGLVTANRAAELGRSVLVLEMGAEEKYLCNTRFTGGTLHLCMNDIMLGEAELRALIERAAGHFGNADLMDSMARNASRAVRWLQSQGLRFLKASGSAHHKWVLAPPGRSRPGLDWEGRAGDVLLRTLEANLAKHGGRVQRATRARSLVMENGRCAGVVAVSNGEERTYRAGAVVIADGGFQGSPELVAEHVTPSPDRVKQRGAGTGVGDGLRMAKAAGAAAVGLDRFYGHVLSRDAMHNDQLWPYPYLDAVVTAAIVVDANGRRIADEGGGGVYVANALAGLDDPLSAFVVFDEAIWQGPGRNGLIPANPHLPGVGGTLYKADDVEGLAKLVGIDAAALAETVAGYNDAHRDDGLDRLDPPRRRERYTPMPITAPPFYAAPLCAGITYTMGGIAVDGSGRALTEDGRPIPGLFAVGACTGGLEGGPGVGYVGGLAKSTVLGLCAAETIAEFHAPAQMP